jgi:hypothetical protein
MSRRIVSQKIVRSIVDRIKLERGCEDPFCHGHPRVASALQFDHIDPATKYRTRTGKLVHLADMVKGGRYGIETILAEIAKCRVLCANCHAVHTHTVQRGG